MERHSLSPSLLCYSIYSNSLIQNCLWSCQVGKRIDIISAIKRILELLVLRKEDRGRGGFQSKVGGGDGCRIGFLPLKSSAVEQNSQIPKDLLAEFDSAPKLCSRSTTGKRAFQLKKRVPECAEFTTEKPLLCRARKSMDRDTFPSYDGEGNISMKITWRSNAQERCKDHEADTNRYAPPYLLWMLEES